MTAFRSFHPAGLASLAFAVVMSAGAVSAAPSADAPPPAPPAPRAHAWHRGPERMFEKLGLSDAQKASVKNIFETDGKHVRDLHVQMRTNMEKLHQAKPDDPAYTSLVSQVARDNGALTTQEISARGAMRARLYAVLTPAQKTQLADLEARMKARMKSGAHRWHHGRDHDRGQEPGRGADEAAPASAPTP